MKALAVLLVLLALPARAQVPALAELDRLYAAGQYREVSQRMFATRDNAEARAILGWAQARVQAAAPHVIAVAYSDLLWQIGEGQSNDALREEAGLVLVYSILAVGVDGAKCADASASDARVRQILSTRQARLDFARGRPADRRAHLRNSAVALEQSTAARRPEDRDICAAGEDEIARQLATPGTVAREQPLKPGEARRTVDIEPGPTYRPRFLGPESWHPRQTQVRARFARILDQLVPA
ncbi:MAG: hypothetical protein JNL71_06005 [Rhodospirillales bacterium]|nr:hypothetical protein [Rhodospirillales bacterium]